jgi:general L-amino acid transport system substrate-binding protein
MIFKYVGASFAVAAMLCGSATAQTLKTVQDRGHLICGVSDGLPGFSAADSAGAWTGFDVDFCRALSAAIFNDPAKVEFVALPTNDRFSALQDKKVDVLSRNTTWTMGRETGLGLTFAAVDYYDGQGFMVRKSTAIESALELGGKTICTQSNTTTELNLADYFRDNRLPYTAAKFATAEEALKAYDGGSCDAMTSDVAQLHAFRSKLGKPTEHIILPDIISKEPLGPVVRQDDVKWTNIVKWTQFALVNAEELGVGLKTLDEAMKSQKPSVQRLLGVDGDFGEQLGLTKDWAARIVRLVGNYGEIFERNLGTGSPLAIPRGINNLWNRGGIQYAPPIR